MLKIAKDFNWSLDTFLIWGKDIRETFENECLFTLSTKNKEASVPIQQLHNVKEQVCSLAHEVSILRTENAKQAVQLEKQAGQLEKQASQLEKQDVQLKKQGVQLENQNILLQQMINLMTRDKMNASFAADQNQDLFLDNVDDDQDLGLVDNQETANMHELNNIHQLNCSANGIQKLQKITSSCARNLLLNVLKGCDYIHAIHILYLLYMLFIYCIFYTCYIYIVSFIHAVYILYLLYMPYLYCIL